MTRCKNCLIPDTVPGVTLAADGVCNFCHQEAEQREVVVAAEETARQEREADLERTLADCRGQAEYDCVVPLSGGKDSIYLLCTGSSRTTGSRCWRSRSMPTFHPWPGTASAAR
ncbi:MAG: hypothetical protein EA420_14275 [Candidatus Competibacteraceae bacterium]|nr:MAG: hypothetical protein EA420_14275 [Candidatus Competibacteraceae bacterium]